MWRQRDREQTRRRAQLDRKAGAQDETAVIAVCSLAGEQHQQKRRQELHEPDQPEIERAVGELIDLIADGDREHVVGDVGGEPRREQQRKGADAVERRRGIDGEFRNRRRVGGFRSSQRIIHGYGGLS